MIGENLETVDPEVFRSLVGEIKRQGDHIELIASENFVSRAVLQAQGSVLTNKYAEGYPGHRYYKGCEYVDEIENLAIDRARKLFGANYANVQPHSGSQANQSVLFGLLQPGDCILGMSLDSGGHLTHGHHCTLSGKWFKVVSYTVRSDTYLIDYDHVMDLAKQHRPKLIIAGYSAYPRGLDFKEFRKIADTVGAYLMTDIAHIAGLVATGHHPSPMDYADVVTSTTHKTLRGPRGGLVLSNNLDIVKKLNSAVFPGIQGGPLMHVIAAKAVAFQEALRDEYSGYIARVVANAKVLASRLEELGCSVLTGGTDNHMLLLDLRKCDFGGSDEHISGKLLADALHDVHITCNKNSVPFDDVSPAITSGVRIGTPAFTTRGFTESEFTQVGDMIVDIIKAQYLNGHSRKDIEETVKQKAIDLCANFPLTI